MKHSKTKRIFALIGVVLMLGLYASTLVFSMMDSALAKNLLMASVAATLIIPIILYAMSLAPKWFGKKEEE